MAYTGNDRPLDWDDEITKDEQIIILPDGDYNFVINGIERGQYNGSDKIPPCKMVTVTFGIDNAMGNVTVQERYYLVASQEWKLSQLFTGVGLKKKNEPLRMNWNALPGKVGKCKIGHRTYNGNEYNQVQRIHPATASGSAPTFTPGQF